MKTTITIKQTLLALTIALSIVSCKKDKKDEPTPPPASVQAITITDLKALSTSASVTIPDNRKINGTVISDVSSKNIDSKTVVLQQSTGKPGIVVTFDAAQTFAAGDSLEVVVSKQTLAQVNGETVLQNIPAANAKKLGTATVTARTTNAAAITQNAAAWDGTLVTIPTNSLTGGNGKYTGTLTLADTTGTLSTAISAGATFENTAYPVSVSAVTGIVRINGTTVLVDIRKSSDVVTGAVTRIITENFDNLTAQAFGFTTAAGVWNTGNTQIYTGNAFIAKGLAEDASFTTPGKSYLYESSQSLESNTALECDFNNLQGLKTVSITFAQSKITTFSFGGSPSPVNPFDPSQDYTQIVVQPWVFGTGKGGQGTSIYNYSPMYMKAGQFNTYTWTVPTKDQLLAAGVNSANADAWLANPYFVIYNLSKTEGNAGFSMILFDKVVFGF